MAPKADGNANDGVLDGAAAAWEAPKKEGCAVVPPNEKEGVLVAPNKLGVAAGVEAEGAAPKSGVDEVFASGEEVAPKAGVLPKLKVGACKTLVE